MPVNKFGQLITFSIEADPDDPALGWQWIHVKKGDTVQKVASRRGHPELARKIANANGIRSVRTKFKKARRLKVPRLTRATDVFSVLAGDRPPTPVGGYAKFSILDRPGRVGHSRFEGYDPIAIEVDIRFENYIEGEGVDIERDIALLERMAGRGVGTDAQGPPPIIRVSTTSSTGEIVPLIPKNYQWSQDNPGAPLWRVVELSWDDSVGEGVIRNRAGNRVRQKATVTLWQRTRVQAAVKR